MFGTNKISGAKASAGVLPAAQPAKPPMVSGGAAMMLKSMGVNPEQMEALAEAFLSDVSSMAKRVDALELGVAELKVQNDRIEATLALILKKVSSNV